MASKNVLADLVLRLSTNDAQLEAGLKKSKQSLNSFGRTSNSVSSGVISAVGKMAAGYFTVSGAINATKKIIASTQGTADSFAAAMSGASFSTNALATSIATLDFDNLVEGMTKGYKAGKEYAQILDDIFDRENSLKVIQAEAEAAMARNRTVMLDAGSSAEEKATAASDTRQRSDDLYAQQVELINKKIDAEHVYWNSLRKTGDLTEEENKLIEDYLINYSKLTNNQISSINDLANAYQKVKDKEDLIIKTGNSRQSQNQLIRAQEEFDALYTSSDEVVQKFFQVGDVINKIKDEHRTLFTDIIAQQSQIAQQQETYIQQANRGESRAEKASDAKKSAMQTENEQLIEIINNYETYGKAIDPVTEQIQLQNEALKEQLKSVRAIVEAENGTVSNISISNPTGFFDWTSDNTNLVASSTTVSTETLSSWEQLIGYLNDYNTKQQLVTSGIYSMDAAFMAMFGNAKGGNKAILASVLEAGRQILNVYLSEAIAGAIAGEAHKGLTGLITGAVAVSGLMALWHTKVPEFANGGLVYGPTIGLMGEYAGAATDPEVISPLSKLENMIGGNVWFGIEGDNLEGVLERKNKKRIYFG
jgi:hypothetical protein